MAKAKQDVKKVRAVATSDKPTHQEDPFLTLSEVGKQMGKHHTTIGSYIKDGLLNAVRSPSKLPMVRQSEVDRFLGGSALASSRVLKQNAVLTEIVVALDELVQFMTDSLPSDDARCVVAQEAVDKLRDFY